MSSIYDPRIHCSIQQAFPAAFAGDVLAVAHATSVTEGSGPFPVVLHGERLTLPYRVHADAVVLSRAEVLTPAQGEILACVFSRHSDGRVRERALRQVVRSSNHWVIPFVFQLVSEYVIEIHRVVQDAMPFMNGAQYAAFLRENPDFYRRTRQRAVSYWNRYYRWDSAHFDRAKYPAFEVLKHFDALIERPRPDAERP